MIIIESRFVIDDIQPGYMKGGTFTLPYVEIYPIEKYAEKIDGQLDKLLESKPTMYAKTRHRYRKLAYSLLQSVEKISSILEEQSLISDMSTDDEFDELSASTYESNIDVVALSQAADNVRSQISSYSQFTSSTKPCADVPSISNREVIAKFAKVLEEASKHHFKCVECDECAQIIYKWFKTRFLTTSNPKFRYNIKHIPTWITNIMILYGEYQSRGEVDTVSKMFDDWCDNVKENDTNIWAVPYEVHMISKTSSPEMFTLNSVVLSDILMEEQYYLLTHDYFSNSHVYLDISPVASLVKQHNQGLTPQIRTRIANQDQFIKICNFTPRDVE